MQQAKNSRRPAQLAGFTLIEIAVVIVVLSLLLAMIAGIGTAMLGQQRREATRQRLAGLETAIALYVSENTRLPCPADGRVAGTNVNAGLENPTPPTGTCDSNQAHGVVPWRTLGLAEQDATDGWGNRFTYRAAPDFVLFLSMNMTYCDPGGSKLVAEAPIAAPAGYCDPLCASATFATNCTRPSAVTANRGLRIQNLVGAVTMNPLAVPSTGAAYVVISHGENGEGAYNNQGVLQGASGDSSGSEEGKNFANLPLSAACPAPGGTTCYFVDDFYASGASHFDDFVLRPTILSVATKAQLGPRAH